MREQFTFTCLRGINSGHSPLHWSTYGRYQADRPGEEEDTGALLTFQMVGYKSPEHTGPAPLEDSCDLTVCAKSGCALSNADTQETVEPPVWRPR